MDAHLESLARLRMTEGELPLAPTLMPDAVRGDGGVCALCEQIMEPGAATILLRWVDRDDKNRRESLHPVCHAIWLVVAGERRRGRS
jgi:hypothetical protein